MDEGAIRQSAVIAYSYDVVKLPVSSSIRSFSAKASALAGALDLAAINITLLRRVDRAEQLDAPSESSDRGEDVRRLPG